jgi:diadenylate cyclase
MPRWQTIADGCVVAISIYFFLLWTRGNRLRGLMLGIAGLFAGGSLASRMDLPLTGWILQASGVVAGLFLVTVFQTELRHLMMRTESWVRRADSPVQRSAYLEALAGAAFVLSEARVGALIVLVRDQSLGELSTKGVEVESPISAELLEAIFQRQSPIHDGAVVIEKGKIVRAGVLLPLTDRTDVPTCFGTRHRAALGICERCDASVVVVSEQRRKVTFVSGRHWRQALAADELLEFLRNSHGVRPQPRASRARSLLVANTRQKLAAVGLTAAIWVVSLLSTNTAIRDFSIPVEFTNLPAGLDISRPSAKQLDVRVRGPRWVIESLRPSQLSARFDLSRATQGVQVAAQASDVVNLPAGVSVERVSPVEVVVKVVPARAAGDR